MALDYLGRYNRSMDHEFRQRVKVAVVDYAKDIYVETPSTPGHAERATFANAVTLGIESYIHALATSVSANIAIDTPTDANLKGQVTSLWNLWAHAPLA